MGWLKKVIGLDKKAKEVPFVQVTDENFQAEVSESELPVMLFVWSNSCPYCKKMAPNVKAVGNSMSTLVKPVHTNSEHSPKALAALGLRSVPTTMFINQGRVVERVIGFKPQSYLEELIEAKFTPNQPAATSE